MEIGLYLESNRKRRKANREWWKEIETLHQTIQEEKKDYYW